MKRPEIDSNNHVLTVQIPPEIYTKLLEIVKSTGKTESELVIQGVQQVLDKFERFDLKNDDQARFADLEISLEKKLKQYVENLISDRFASAEFRERSRKSHPEQDRTSQEKAKNSLPIPTIRPLQIGDRVLILEPDSAYYMAKLLVVRTSLIRATVATETGEMTFLKRDLRFVESTQ
jgi:predicted DNA-binding protein